ncbi:hypothetical protein Taro_012254 [Colocasia esculenta]|uniref:STAR protein homodimerisation region domain-containing protein n=1 Tax=Colocasia esculenta TaxID=4460 RepID=A0A843UD23_COLES|nr:hypothetical protein [Colocasia esculenta]
MSGLYTPNFSPARALSPQIRGTTEIDSQYLTELLAEHQKLGPFVQVLPICSRLLNQGQFLSLPFGLLVLETILTPADLFTYGSRNIAFVIYNEHWRQAKKAVVVHLLSPKKVQYFRRAREKEVAFLLQKIAEEFFVGIHDSLQTDMVIPKYLLIIVYFFVEIMRVSGMVSNHGFSDYDRLQYRSPSPMASANLLSDVGGTGLGAWSGFQPEVNTRGFTCWDILSTKSLMDSYSGPVSATFLQDESQDYFKRQQLRELAMLNSSIREDSPHPSGSLSPFGSSGMKRAKTGR